MAYLCSFADSVAYALAVLIQLTSLSRWNRSIQCKLVMKEMMCSCGNGKSLCYQVLPFVFDHKLGLIGSEWSSAVLVVYIWSYLFC